MNDEPQDDSTELVEAETLPTKKRRAPIQKAAEPRNLDEIQRVAQILHQSKFFSDIKSASQATAKILAGAELGLAPMESMRSVHAFNGKTSLHYSQILALIRRSGKYDYQIVESTDKEAEILFLRRVDGEWREEGTQKWTWEDAENAGLTGKDNWENYPRAMLLSRCTTEGQRKYCPDVGGGPLYAPEELGAEVDEQGRVTAPPQSSDPPKSENKPKGGGPDPASQMMNTMGRVLGKRPAWLIEAITGFRPKNKADLTQGQINQVNKALDQISEIIHETGMDEPLKWLVWTDKHTDLDIPDDLNESVQRYRKHLQEHNPPKEKKDNGPSFQDILVRAHAKLANVQKTGDNEMLGESLDEVHALEDKYDLSNGQIERLRRLVTPYMTVFHIRNAVRGGEIDHETYNTYVEWFTDRIEDWPREKAENALEVVENEIDRLREQVDGFTTKPDAEKATDAMMSGDTALDSGKEKGGPRQKKSNESSSDTSGTGSGTSGQTLPNAGGDSSNELPDGPLPSNFPGKTHLEKEGHDTIGKVERLRKNGQLQEVDQIGKTRAEQIRQMLGEMRRGDNEGFFSE